MKKRKKKESEPYVDDGHTVFNMDGVGGAHHVEKEEEHTRLTRAERRAILRAALSSYLPVFGLILLCFTVVLLMLYFWLMK